MTSSARPESQYGGRRAPRAASSGAERQFWKLKLGAVWSSFFRQSFAFWCVSFYLFIEYVRPQQIYDALRFAPWGKIALGLAVVSSLIEGRLALREKISWSLIGLFSLIILASSAAAFDPALAFDNLNVWGIWLLAMLVVAGCSRSRVELALSVFLWCLWNLKMSQSAFRSWMMEGFRFRDWGASGSPGWFQNSGEFGIEMCVFLPIVGYFLAGLWPSLSRTRRIILGIVALSAIVGAMASSSRGALLGCGLIGLWVLLRSKNRIRVGLVVAVLSVVVWSTLPAENKKRWSEAGEDKTSTLRIQYWKDGIEIASQHPVLGVGYWNWLPYYQTNYNPRGQQPHNIFVQCAAELGYSGLIVFVALIGITFYQNWETRKLSDRSSKTPDRLAFYLAYGFDGALVGYVASGFFVTVLYYPYFWINLGFTMALSRYAHDNANGVRRGAVRPSRLMPPSRTGLMSIPPVPSRPLAGLAMLEVKEVRDATR